MIDESSQPSLLCGINILSLLNHHEIKMFDAFLVVFMHSLSECVLLNHFSDIFVDEGVFGDIDVCTDTVSFTGCEYDVYGGVFTALETLVSTACATGTLFIGAFHRRGKVDAVIVAAGQVCAVFCNLSKKM
jgi:hypothetical protein